MPQTGPRAPIACLAAAMAAALLAASPSLAAAPAAGANSPARAQVLAKLPDWSGLWKTRGSFAVISRTDLQPFVKGNRDSPPYKPDWEARYAANILRAESQGDPNAKDPLIDSHTSYCAAGAVRLIASPFDYNFVVTPEATWILASGEVRQIYTDGRQFPAGNDIWPKFAGWSIGHWEGDTLVAETRGLKSEMWLDSTPMVISEAAVVAERIRRIDADTLEDQVTITDPVAFTAPWRFTRHYTRLKDGLWGDEKEICGGPEDRNPIVDGRITIQLAPQK